MSHGQLNCFRVLSFLPSLYTVLSGLFPLWTLHSIFWQRSDVGTSGRIRICLLFVSDFGTIDVCQGLSIQECHDEMLD